MDDVDLFATQRAAPLSVVTDLAAAGLENAEEVGHGGFGIVFRCRQASLDRVVAVKVLTADLDEQNQARFLREQRAAGRLTGHPNVINVLYSGVTDAGRLFIVMPYCSQGSLDRKIRREGPLPLDEALRLGVKIAGCVETAHQLGILHRDIKPGNILMTDYGQPALSDFGISRIVDDFETTSGIVTGSLAFTAPEVLGGGPPSPAADVYSLATTIFTALTGHAAFERRSGEQLTALLARIASGQVPDLREQGLAEDVCFIVEQAMSTNPRTRPDAADLGRRLRIAQLSHGFTMDEMVLHIGPDGGGSLQSTRFVPPLSSGSAEASRGKGNLPLELTSFVGRRPELRAAKNLLSSSRLVTLTGIGGVGKTRMALRVAAKSESDFADGAWLVEWGELRDDSLLADVVASVLRLVDRSTRSEFEVLVEFLASRELLLVLDNCEHMIVAVADLVQGLLRGCPRLRVLATSREPLDIGGEAVLLIPPLVVPDLERPQRRSPRDDALTLFVERGAAVVPGFKLTAENELTIARICQRLEGLPLPIELAAARLRTMTPEQILQRLADRFALLTRGPRDMPSRQRTLRICIDWSYDLCTPTEQRLWAELSVFTGSFELAAIEQVCRGPYVRERFLDSLTFLVDKSILFRESTDAVLLFHMLETLREYGREKAQDAGIYPELRRRHRDWYERLALEAEADWISARQRAWITRIEGAQSNLREALEFSVSDDPEAGLRIAGALLQFWLSRGLLSEGRRWLDRLLNCRTGPLTADRAKAMYAITLLAGVQGDTSGSIVLLEEGRALLERVSDPVTRAHIDLADGYLALFEGNLSDARTHLENAVEVYTACNSILLQINALDGLGMTHQLLNETDMAIDYFERALSITETHDESTYRSYVLWALAVAVWKGGENTRAVQLLDQALQQSRSVSDHHSAGQCLQALAWIAAKERSFRRAVLLIGAADHLSRSAGRSTVLFPGLLPYHEECIRECQSAMSVHTFDLTHEQGEALGFDAAVAYARGEQTPSKLRSTSRSVKPTNREQQVAELVVEGLTNREIAARLVISPRTAQGHVENLLNKLGFTSRAQIAAWMVERQQSSFRRRNPDCPGSQV